MITWK